MDAAVAQDGPIVIFDGACGLCSGWVTFVLRHDRRGVFRVTPFQSPAGARLLEAYGLASASAKSAQSAAGAPAQSAASAQSVVLVTRGRALRRSTAVLHILRGLGGVWALGYAAIVIPAPIRDAVYDFVAARRYRWFGRRDACRAPAPEERARFV